jgi:DeoR family fructose operon transcriptional repressor
MILAPRPNITLMILGGRVRGRTPGGGRRMGRQALRDTFVDVAFVGTNGMSENAASPPPTRPRRRPSGP